MTPEQLAARGLRVKPLVWDGSDENCYAIADMGNRYYEVTVVDVLERPCDYLWSATYTERPEFILGLGGGSFEEAKAAAEADHVARVAAMVEGVE